MGIVGIDMANMQPVDVDSAVPNADEHVVLSGWDVEPREPLISVRVTSFWFLCNNDDEIKHKVRICTPTCPPDPSIEDFHFFPSPAEDFRE